MVVFLPTSERFARAVAGQNYRIHKIATSPYFDLTEWNPRGNSAKHLRTGLNRARRAGVTIEPVTEITIGFRNEVAGICKTWLKGRSAGMSFGGSSTRSIIKNYKKYFGARGGYGQLVGILRQRPIRPVMDGILKTFCGADRA